MSLGDRIKERRLELGLSQLELARKIGYSTKASISDMEHDRTSMTMDRLRKIARALELDPGELAKSDTYDLVKNKDDPIKKKNIIIPILGRVAAGFPKSAIPEIEGYEEISSDMADTGRFFALRIKGNSMEPLIADGSVVIVRQQDYAETGQIVIAMIDGEDAVCKKIVTSNRGITLVSMNPAYDPLVFSNEDIRTIPVRIIGRVVEIRIKLV